MSGKTNREISKNTMTTAALASGGLLNPEQFKEFIRLIQDQPTLLSDVRIQPMKSHTAKMESFEFGGRITFKGREGVAATDNNRKALTASKVTLEAQELQCEVAITQTMREDNIVQGNLDDYVRNRMVERFSLDLQDLIVLGKKSVKTDPLLQTLDGIFEQTTSHVISLTKSPAVITDDVFYRGFLALPDRFRKDRKNLRFYCNSDVITAFNHSLSSRETTLGDVRMVDGTERTYWNGVELYDVTSMPSGSYILTNRKNIVVGIYREVLPYTEEHPSARSTYYGLTMRVDVKYGEEDAAVKVSGLNIPTN